MTDTDDAVPVLPRELTSVTDEVRTVPAPRTPVLAEPYSIRPADPSVDAELVSEWMNRPHLAEAWEYDNPPTWWRDFLRFAPLRMTRLAARRQQGGVSVGRLSAARCNGTKVDR